jgi:cytochrome b5
MGPVYNLAEVKKHIKEDDCWIIVHGKVYDVTKFLDEHPGGFDIIISNTGATH